MATLTAYFLATLPSAFCQEDPFARPRDRETKKQEPKSGPARTTRGGAVDLFYSEEKGLPAGIKIRGALTPSMKKIAKAIFESGGRRALDAQAKATLQAFLRDEVRPRVHERDGEPWKITLEIVSKRQHYGSQIKRGNRGRLQNEAHVLRDQLAQWELVLNKKQMGDLRFLGSLKFKVVSPFQHLTLWKPRPTLALTVLRRPEVLEYRASSQKRLRVTAYVPDLKMWRRAKDPLWIHRGDSVSFSTDPRDANATWRIVGEANRIQFTGAKVTWDTSKLPGTPPQRFAVYVKADKWPGLPRGYQHVFDVDLEDIKSMVLMYGRGLEKTVEVSRGDAPKSIQLTDAELAGAWVSCRSFPDSLPATIKRIEINRKKRSTLAELSVGGDPAQPQFRAKVWRSRRPRPPILRLEAHREGVTERKPMVLEIVRPNSLKFEEKNLALMPGEETSPKSDASVRDLTLVARSGIKPDAIRFKYDTKVLSGARVVGSSPGGREHKFRVRVAAVPEAKLKLKTTLRAEIKGDPIQSAEIPVDIRPMSIEIIKHPTVYFARTEGVFWLVVNVKGAQTPKGQVHDRSFRPTEFAVEFRHGAKVLIKYRASNLRDMRDYMDSSDGWLALFVPNGNLRNLPSRGKGDDVADFEFRGVQVDLTLKGRFGDGDKVVEAEALGPASLESLWSRDMPVADIGASHSLDLKISKLGDLGLLQFGQGYVDTRCSLARRKSLKVRQLKDGSTRIVSVWDKSHGNDRILYNNDVVQYLKHPSRYIKKSRPGNASGMDRHKTLPNNTKSGLLWKWNFSDFAATSEAKGRGRFLEARITSNSADYVWHQQYNLGARRYPTYHRPLFDKARISAHIAGHVVGTYFGVYYPLILDAAQPGDRRQLVQRIKGYLNSDPRQHSLLSRNARLALGLQPTYSFENTTAAAMKQDGSFKRGAQAVKVLYRAVSLYNVLKLKEITTAIRGLFEIRDYSRLGTAGAAWNFNTDPLKYSVNGAMGSADLLMYEYHQGKIGAADLGPESSQRFPRPMQQGSKGLKDQKVMLKPIQRSLQPNAVYFFLLHSQARAWAATHGYSRWSKNPDFAYPAARVSMSVRLNGDPTLRVDLRAPGMR